MTRERDTDSLSRQETAARRINLADTFTEFFSESSRRLNQAHERTLPRRQASVIGTLDDDVERMWSGVVLFSTSSPRPGLMNISNTQKTFVQDV